MVNIFKIHRYLVNISKWGGGDCLIKNELIRTFAQLKNDAYSINDYIVR